MAGLAAGQLKIFAGIYILVIALIGTALFLAAPKLNRMIFGKLAETKGE
ncbi:hypothetical protein [Bacillus sp. FJAT-27245]|nr:hypothetical protein [Bacillus sp. FJAT-27245]